MDPSGYHLSTFRNKSPQFNTYLSVECNTYLKLPLLLPILLPLSFGLPVAFLPAGPWRVDIRHTDCKQRLNSCKHWPRASSELSGASVEPFLPSPSSLQALWSPWQPSTCRFFGNNASDGKGCSLKPPLKREENARSPKGSTWLSVPCLLRERPSGKGYPLFKDPVAEVCGLRP